VLARLVTTNPGSFIKDNFREPAYFLVQINAKKQDRENEEIDLYIRAA
jgi:hypothetical protein